jgi:hypothetical protein
MEQQHAIGKLVVEVQLPSRDEAFSLQRTLSDRCNEALMPMLAAVLDTWTDPDTLLQIDKIELDLGNCSMQALQEELPDLVIDYLRKHFQHITPGAFPELHMESRPLTQGYFESWLYFMEHGVLRSAAVKWETAGWEASILTVLATETRAVHQCQQLFATHPYAVSRLVMQFSRSFVYNWILAFSAGAYRQALVLIEEWEAFVYSPRFIAAVKAQFSQSSVAVPALPDHMTYAERVMEWLIREIVITGKPVSHPALQEQLVRLMGSEQELPDRLFTLERVTASGVKMPVMVRDAVAAVAGRYASEMSVRRQHFKMSYDIERALIVRRSEDSQGVSSQSENNEGADKAGTQQHDTTSSQEPSSVKNNPADEAGSAVPKTPAEINMQREVQKSVDQDSRPQTENEDIDRPLAAGEAEGVTALPAEGTVYYINNAGLILLHPYLCYCFDALELREGKQFRDKAARHKAVQLLGYMAYGDGDIPEYDLVLPKLLCGIAPAEPIKRFVALSDVEKDEANQLLAAVITHWNALGNTSPDGLRGNFLLREGKLEWKEEEWQLYVTQQPYDMLLNRLPWGISVVGLSWMPWLIKTVWV